MTKLTENISDCDSAAFLKFHSVAKAALVALDDAGVERYCRILLWSAENLFRG